MTKVTAISDLHGTLPMDLPQCDILAIAGDVCPVDMPHGKTVQRQWLADTFFPWCDGLVKSGVAGNVVFTPGNHDFAFTGEGVTTPYPDRVTCLIDAEATVAGLRIYGTPWTPVFMRWAFMENEHYLKARFSRIPAGLDILLSHGPARGWADVVLTPVWTYSGDEHLGSVALREAVKRAKPKWLLCGHIHTGDHVAMPVCDGATMVANVSMMDERYSRSYPPLTFEI